jgi:hypothetical protein
MFCPHCGKEIAENQAFCQFCGGTLTLTAPGTGRSKTAWEAEATQWTFGGLVTTLKGSLFNPSEFFRTMNVAGGLTGPMLYAMIVGMAGIMLLYFWQIVLRDTYPASLSSSIQGTAGINMFTGVSMGVMAVVTPFLIIAGLFLGSGMLHLLLLMVRGSKNGFEATFRVMAYAYGSNIFMAVPFCGGFIAALWNIVVVIIGLKEAHGTSGGKAAFAVLFPVLLCCAVAVLFSILVLGTVAASFGTMPHQPWK